MRRAKHDRRPRQDRSEPQQLKLFRALPGDLAPRDAQDLMAYPFFSLAKSKRLQPIDFRAGAVSIRVEAATEHGMPPSGTLTSSSGRPHRSSMRATRVSAPRP